MQYFSIKISCLENSPCTISSKSVENWLRNRRKTCEKLKSDGGYIIKSKSNQEHWESLFKFSVTWSCVSLPRSTTSSDCKFVWFAKFKSKHIFQCFKNEMKWNELGFRPPLCTYRLNWARRTHLRKVRWVRWHCPPDTGFEIRTLGVWGRVPTSRSRRLPTILSFSSLKTYCTFTNWLYRG